MKIVIGDPHGSRLEVEEFLGEPALVTVARYFGPGRVDDARCIALDTEEAAIVADALRQFAAGGVE